MTDEVILKIYNKDNKLKFLFRDTSITKTVSIYKYNGENIDIHSFTYSKGGELKSWQAYYELVVKIDDVLSEMVLVSKDFIEHYKYVDDMSIITTTTNLISGNIYEKRVKYFNGEKYEVEFLNKGFRDIHFRIKKNKINEYLKK